MDVLVGLLTRNKSWVLALCLAGSSVLGGGGYLARVGPAPLRFKKVSEGVSAEQQLPPLDMGKGAVTSSEVDEPEQASELMKDPEKTSVQSLSPVVPLAPEEPSAAAIAPVPGNPQLQPTPQMFLRYFTRDTNAEAIVQAPIDFTPPKPTQGSSATYLKQ